MVFPEQHGWSGVSDAAKDLIERLLVRDASQRMDAEAVMSHPWIAGTATPAFAAAPAAASPQQSESAAEPQLRRQASSNVSLAWLFDKANSVVAHNKNNNNNFDVGGNRNRKVSMNDRLMLRVESASRARKTSMMDSMRRQTSLVFPDDCNDLLQRHFNLHRCEL